MAYPYPKNKENTWIIERKEVSPPTITVAGSHFKHRSTKKVLVPSETSLRDVFVATLSCKSGEESLAEGLLHNPHKKATALQYHC